LKLNLLRMGLLIILFGLAVMGATVANDTISWANFAESGNVPANGDRITTFYQISRTAHVVVEGSIDFRGKLYILDQTGIKRWLEEDVFDPIVTEDIFGGLSTYFQPPTRGFYAFIVHNDLNESQQIAIRSTEYGLEYDLLEVSGAFLVVGSVFILSWLVVRAFTYKESITKTSMQDISAF
jgi:hypothetical protein